MQLEGAARYIGRTPGQREREQGCGGDDLQETRDEEENEEPGKGVCEEEANEGRTAHDKHLSRQFESA